MTRNKILILLTVFLSFAGCEVANKSVNIKNEENNNTLNIVTKNENKKITPVISKIKKPLTKKLVMKKSSNSPEISKVKRPLEVERVCFDKSGAAHNCNYKIPKPY